MEYQTISVSVPGRKHIREGIPCQDACLTAIQPRPLTVVCDGRGSATHSHHGAQAAVTAIAELTTVLHPLLVKTLDQEAQPDPTAGDHLAELFYRGAAIVQQRLAQTHKQSPEDYQFTMLLAIGGTHRFFLMQIGDGGIALKSHHTFGLVFVPQRGEFANITQFVQFGTPPPHIENQFINTPHIQALALFTDGTADRMIRNQTHQPADGFITIWQKMAQGKFNTRDLRRFLTENSWEPAVLDDRTMALLVITNNPKNQDNHPENPIESPLIPTSDPTNTITEELTTEPEQTNKLLIALLAVIIIQTTLKLLSLLQATSTINI